MAIKGDSAKPLPVKYRTIRTGKGRYIRVVIVAKRHRTKKVN